VREYETTVIIQPEISDEAVQELCTRLDGVVEGDGGLRLMYDDQGRRRLAYEIQNFQKGRYVMLHFLGDGPLVPVIERVLRLEDSVLRFLTVQVSEEVVDIEARKAAADEEVRIREQKAAERAAREAEQAAERAAREAEEAAAAAKAAEATKAAESEAAAKAAESEAAAKLEEAQDEGETEADADQATEVPTTEAPADDGAGDEEANK
jgi:small subunit ribosomal protein S6